MGRVSDMKSPVSVRKWLLENGYPEVASQIDEIIEEWRVTGQRTRRNWWDILAGDKDGKPRTVAGRAFPVLRVVRLRQHLPEAVEAMTRGEKTAPPIIPQARWAEKKR
jgi:hypothetical protein